MDGVLVRPHFDSNGKDFAIEHIQDVEPILRWNRQARQDEQHSDWGRHVARIPNVIYVKWLDEEHARGNTGVRLFTLAFQGPDWDYSLVPSWLRWRDAKNA